MVMRDYGAAKWMKKAKSFGYARISTEKQAAADRKQKDVKKKPVLVRQMNEVNENLKKLGLPQVKSDDWYVEIGTGTNADRSQWRAMRAAAMAHSGEAFIAVKDPTRWARNVDDSVEAWAPLKRRGVPIFAVSTGIQTGDTIHGRRPSENFFFLLNSGFAAQTSEIQQEKADAGVERQTKEGALAGTGSSLFPFAQRDPVQVYLENENLLSQPKGKKKLYDTVGLLSNPNGMKSQSVVNLKKKIEGWRETLTNDQFIEYLEFREWLRQKSIELDADAWTDKTKYLPKGSKTNYYPMRAIMRMSGLYLGNPHLFEKPDYKFLASVEKNYVDYLSDKDKDRRGHR
jgi:DNA invertase Pin-like site-specific DNA recombinase